MHTCGMNLLLIESEMRMYYTYIHVRNLSIAALWYKTVSQIKLSTQDVSLAQWVLAMSYPSELLHHYASLIMSKASNARVGQYDFMHNSWHLALKAYISVKPAGGVNMIITTHACLAYSKLLYIQS